jgi:hypothetical protein
MSEKWKPVYGYEDCYAISDRGNLVRTSLTKKRVTQIWRPVKLKTHRDGYKMIGLCRDKIKSFRMAHRLVWEAFKEPLKPKQQINHLNGNKADNRLSNLEACYHSQNMIHAFRVLKRSAPNNPSYGSNNGSSKLNEKQVAEILALYTTGEYTQQFLAQKFGVSQRMISLITRREKWQHVNAATVVM